MNRFYIEVSGGRKYINAYNISDAKNIVINTMQNQGVQEIIEEHHKFVSAKSYAVDTGVINSTQKNIRT